VGVRRQAFCGDASIARQLSWWRSIGSLAVVRRRDLAFGLVVVWAFAGIAVKQAATLAVAIAAVLMALLLLAVLFVVVVGSRGATGGMDAGWA